MKQWTLTGPRAMELRDVPAPEPARGEIAIRIEVSAVSAGSELHAFRSGPTDFMRSPGYLAVGVVTATGPEARTFDIGDRVFAVAPHGHAAVVPEHRAVRVPDGVASDQAALAYLGTLGLYCLHAGSYQAGENVAVVGLGVVGVCTALVASLCGARVHALDVDEHRLRLTAGIGLAARDARDPGLADRIAAASPDGIDLVVETSGAWEGLDTAARVCRKGSRISVLGVYRDLPRSRTGTALHERLFTFPARFHYEGIRIIGCANHPWDDGPHDTGTWSVQRALHYLLECMAQGRLDLNPVITDRLRPDELAALYQRLDSGDRTILGAVVDWS